MAAKIRKCFKDADILGYNAKEFDILLLAKEFARVAASSGGLLKSSGNKAHHSYQV